MLPRHFRPLVLAAAALALLAGCAAPVPHVTATPAAAPVGEVDRTYDSVSPDGEERSLAVEITLPDEAGRRPAILFSHGLGGSPSTYAALISGWVAEGYAVIAPLYPHTNGAVQIEPADVLNQMADASAVLDGVLADAELAPRIDASRLAAVGHSAGGITTIGLFTSARDDRLDAGIVLSGSAIGVGDTFSGDPAPILFIHGLQDTVVSYDAGHAAFDADPWPAAFVTLPDAGHTLAVSATDEDFATVTGVTSAFLALALGDGDRAAIAESLHGTATIEDRL